MDQQGMGLSSSEIGIDWLKNFATDAERTIASTLIDEILLVSRNSLMRELRGLIQTVLDGRDDLQRPIALFAERAVRKQNGDVLPFFINAGRGRATGVGVPPIEVDPADQEVGSEGLIANLITDLARLYQGQILPHPGPDRMRSDRVRRIVIVTDFVGSGKRVWEMLEAFQAVATIRSWRSYGLITFYVVAYSGTEEGLRFVRSSRLKPEVLTVTGCPTLWNTFSGTQLSNVLQLCKRYPPRHGHPTGFLNGGALIAFAHGIPNNAPPILHSRTRGWTGLFPKRSTARAEMSFPADTVETIADRAARLLNLRDANKYLASPTGKRWVKTLLVLAALEAGARSVQAVSARSGLPLTRAEEILDFMRIARWTSKNALTRLGRQELSRLRQRRRSAPVLPKSNTPYYYPTQLRAR